MSRQVFVELVTAYCLQTGLDDPERLIRGGAIMIDEVTFSFIYSESVDPQHVCVYCDFGEVPSEKKSNIYEALLETNFFLSSGRGPIFSVSPENGHVLCVSHYVLNELSAEQFAAALEHLVTQALAWRKTYYLNDESESDTEQHLNTATQFLPPGTLRI